MKATVLHLPRHRGSAPLPPGEGRSPARSRDFGLTALCLKWGTAGLCLLLSLLLLHRYGVEHLDWKGLVLCLIGLNLVPLLLAVRPAFRQRPLEERRA